MVRAFARLAPVLWTLGLGYASPAAATPGASPGEGISTARPRQGAFAGAKGRKKRPPKRRHRGARERPVPVYTHGGQPNIQAQAAVVVDMNEGAELFLKNPDEVRPIASISKLMAMMVVLDRKLDLEGVTEIEEGDKVLARRGARSRLPVGAKFLNRDLLHAALMASDNRAVPALGRAVGLDPAGMASAMNLKAASLGLKNTSFGDPTGLDLRNRSTPREVAKFLVAALKVPLIAETTRRARYVTTPVGRGGRRIEYANTDVIARGRRFEVLGGKTGYTDLAGYCLAIAARLTGAARGHQGAEAVAPERKRDVAMVFLGARGKMTRFGDFTRVAQWIAEKHPAGRAAADSTLPPTRTVASAVAITEPGAQPGDPIARQQP